MMAGLREGQCTQRKDFFVRIDHTCGGAVFFHQHVRFPAVQNGIQPTAPDQQLVRIPLGNAFLKFIGKFFIHFQMLIIIHKCDNAFVKRVNNCGFSVVVKILLHQLLLRRDRLPGNVRKDGPGPQHPHNAESLQVDPKAPGDPVSIPLLLRI